MFDLIRCVHVLIQCVYYLFFPPPVLGIRNGAVADSRASASFVGLWVVCACSWPPATLPAIRGGHPLFPTTQPTSVCAVLPAPHDTPASTLTAAPSPTEAPLCALPPPTPTNSPSSSVERVTIAEDAGLAARSVGVSATLEEKKKAARSVGVSYQSIVLERVHAPPTSRVLCFWFPCRDCILDCV